MSENAKVYEGLVERQAIDEDTVKHQPVVLGDIRIGERHLSDILFEEYPD